MSSEEETTAANVLSQMSQMQQIACETIEATVISVGHHCDVETSGGQDAAGEHQSELFQQVVQAAVQQEMQQGNSAVYEKSAEVISIVPVTSPAVPPRIGISGAKVYPCQFCGKEFNKSYNLKTHIRVHTGERPFQCEVCGHGFANLGDLKRHARTHTGEKPFKCEFCSKVFSDFGSHKRHLRLHTGFKPFKCEQCDREFTRLDSFKNHVRLHTGDRPYKCETCAKEFNYLTTYKRHLNIHKGEKPFSCEQCDKKFTRLNYLKNHMNTHAKLATQECQTDVSIMVRSGASEEMDVDEQGELGPREEETAAENLRQKESESRLDAEAEKSSEEDSTVAAEKDTEQVSCNCTANQTQPNTTCDVVSGQCKCNVSRSGGYYGGRQCETCAKHTVGSPPSCHPCKEQCYKNWHSFIEIETWRVNSLKETVAKLLKSFGQMSVDDINVTLRQLHTNVSYAYDVFSKGGREDLKEKKKQIEGIQNTISEFQQELNSSQDTLHEAQQYLIHHVKNFNGSVEIVPAPSDRPLPEVCVQSGGVTVLVDWRCIRTMADAYKLSAAAVYASGRQNYSSIENSSHAIALANKTATKAARQIQEAVAKLKTVGEKRNEVESRLGAHFRAQLKNNSLVLEQIRKITEELLALVQESQTYRDHAQTNVTEAEAAIQSAADTVRLRKSQAYSALQDALNAERNVSQAHQAAVEAQNKTTMFKENATGVLAQAQASLDEVTDGINTVARVTNMTKEAREIGDEVKAMKMPVTLEEIENLVMQINGTQVNETLINMTYEGAAEGLKQAREVEALSQRASDKTQKTLNQVKEIEEAMKEADKLRKETVSLQQQTDIMVSEITNITQSVESRFSEASNVGEETLNLINSTVRSLDRSLKCFDTAKKTATDALKNATMAYNVSKEAKEVFDSSNETLAKAAEEVNTSYEVANANYTDIKQAKHDADELEKDVTEAENLLQTYIEQRDELLALQQQVQDLGGKAEELINKFAEASQKYDKCDGSIPA